MNLQPGQIFANKYRIVRLIGEGGMGAVFEGENMRIRRKVAIKTLHAAVSEKKDVVQRFEREAQAAGRIGSAHIVEVLDLGDLPDGSHFLVMEFLQGVSLEDRIRSQGRLTPDQAVPIVCQLLEGLGAAHNAGIIHRDLKPANVFLLEEKSGQRDFVKIVDFGVSKFNVLNDEMSMTRTGAVVGTPYYMSPEQAKGARGVDGRSDLYAVGVILYECITGQVPFNAETFNELIFKIVLETPPPAESFVPDLDPTFAAILRKAMAREVTDRFQSAEEFRQTLVEWESAQQKGQLPSPGGTTAILPQGAGGFHSHGGAPPTAGMAAGHHAGAPAAGAGMGAAGVGATGGYGAMDAGAAAHYGAPQANGMDESIVLPQKSNGGLVAALAIGAVVVLGGGVFAFYKFRGADDAVASAAEPTDEADTDEADAPSDDEPESDETLSDETDEASDDETASADIDEADGTDEPDDAPEPDDVETTDSTTAALPPPSSGSGAGTSGGTSGGWKPPPPPPPPPGGGNKGPGSGESDNGGPGRTISEEL